MDNQTQTEQSDRKFLWIGIGTVVAILCLLIGFGSLIFGGGESTKKVKKVEKPVVEEPAEKDQPKEEQAKEEPASQPAEQPKSEEPASSATYEVQSGDTLYQIGIDHNVDWQRIAEVNDLDTDVVLKPGDKLIIPSE